MDKIIYEFQPDIELKYIFEKLSNSERITILNELFQIEIPPDTEIELVTNESVNLNLFSDKKSDTRSDMIFQAGQKRKLHLEFQSTEDPNMGIRIFLYGLYSDTKKENHTFHFPMSHILYLVPNREKYSTVSVYLDLPQFQVNGTEYKDSIIQIDIPATNLLQFTLEDFQNSNLLLLGFSYLYRYVKRQYTCKTEKDITCIVQEISTLWNLIYHSGKKRDDIEITLRAMLKLYQDIISIAKRNQVNEEELYMLTKPRKSYIDTLLDEGIEKGIKEGIEKAKEQILEQGMKQGMKQGIEQVTLLYQNLLKSGNMDDLQRAMNDKAFRDKLLEEM